MMRASEALRVYLIPMTFMPHNRSLFSRGTPVILEIPRLTDTHTRTPLSMALFLDYMLLGTLH